MQNSSKIMNPYHADFSKPHTQTLTHPLNLTFLILILAHLPLALLMRSSNIVATLHAIGTFCVGLYFVMHDRSPERTVCLAGYITGAELLWRMTDALIFWEFSKYSILVLFFLATLKFKRDTKINKLPLLYLALLLPATISVLIQYSSLEYVRRTISFNLSGHLNLAVSAIFFSRLLITRETFGHLLFLMIAPICGIAYLAYTGLAETEYIEFTTNSSFLASGGFGPNQVSSVLGLGVFCCWLLVANNLCSKGLKIAILFMILGLLSQAILTLSRGGIIGALISCFIVAIYFLRNRRMRLSIVAIGFLLISSAYFIIIPKLNVFTGGMLTARYENMETTGRWNLVSSDINIFLDNPLLGIGVGNLRHERWLHRQKIGLRGVATAAHTEFSRMLAEHGMLGLIALVVLFSMMWRSYRRRFNPRIKGIVAALGIWALFFMAHSAMRIVAPSFIIGLTMANYEGDSDKEVEYMDDMTLGD